MGKMKKNDDRKSSCTNDARKRCKRHGRNMDKAHFEPEGDVIEKVDDS